MAGTALGIQPYAFLFSSCADLSQEQTETLDEAFLTALKQADPQAFTMSRIYRGSLLIAELSYKPTSIKSEPIRPTKPNRSTGFRIAKAQRSDRGLYAVLVGDFVESCLAQWNTLNSGALWEFVANRAVDATLASSLHMDIAERMDKHLRSHPLYIGAVSPDLGNPLHRYLFMDAMLKDAFIRHGSVFVRAGFEGEDNPLFFGADQFSSTGKVALPHEEFEERAPRIELPATSARGLVTAIRMQKRLAYDVHQKVLSALGRNILGKTDKPFEWDLERLPDAPDEVQVQTRKLTEYLLNPDHERGKSKARFFAQELRITREDWAYLQAQLIDRLREVPYEDVRLDEHGIRFTAFLPVIGRNGSTTTIETGWIIRPTERASLVTAIPAKKSPSLESRACQPRIVSNELKGDSRWRAIYELADQAGKSTMEECVPKPMVVEGDVHMEGLCGGAFIVIKDGRSSFARWLKKQGLADRGYRSGYFVSARQLGQSAETAKAYADAFAKVLLRNGIACRSEGYLS